MKVLWIVNTIFPEAARILNLPEPVIGGWMYASAKHLKEKYPRIELAVATLYKCKNLMRLQGEILYYMIPYNTDMVYDVTIETSYKCVYKEFNPDIVHIHGTEYPHSLAWVNACGTCGLVVSIQGLVSTYSQYYFGGIDSSQIRRYITIRDHITRDTLIAQKKDMSRRGEYEKELLRKVKYVIGRTSWDKANVWAINPNIQYFACNEILRTSFYASKWRLDRCNRHTLFVSQGYYPIKGLHKIIEALELVLKMYTDTQVYIAGYNPIKVPIWKRSGYGKYIQSMITRKGLIGNIHFLGTLTEEEMLNQYLSTHLFVSPSAIENSPNSVGEAQLLGVPCIVSYVGGCMDMIEHERSGLLYRFEETAELASNICRLFADDDWCERLSVVGRNVALRRHNVLANTQQLYTIYQNIQRYDI